MKMCPDISTYLLHRDTLLWKIEGLQDHLLFESTEFVQHLSIAVHKSRRDQKDEVFPLQEVQISISITAYMRWGLQIEIARPSPSCPAQVPN